MAIIGLVSSTHFALDGSLYPRLHRLPARRQRRPAFGGTLSSTSGLYLTVSCPNDAPTMVATILVNFTSL